MLTRVGIKNFRGFQELDAPIGPVTALLGPNSSGKTTVLHAIRLGCELFLQAAEAASASVNKHGEVELREITIRPDTLLPIVDWSALFPSGHVVQGSKIELHLTLEPTDQIHEIWITLAWKSGELLHLKVRAKAPAIAASVAALRKTSQLVNKTLTKALILHAPRAIFVPPFYGTAVGEEFRPPVVLDRLVGSGDQSHAVRNLIGALNFDDFTRLNVFLKDAIGAEITGRTHGDELQTVSPLRVTFRDSNGELELSSAGAGLVNLVALFASLARWRQEAKERPVIFLLDEPEAHLYPKLQAEAVERTALLVTREYAAQLVLATHSVEILNRLSQGGVANLLRCDRTKSPSAVLLKGDNALFRDLSAWADLTPFTAINFLASRRILFCEGATDVDLLPRLARIRFRNAAEQHDRFTRWVPVELGSSGNEDVARTLNKLLKSDAVKVEAKDPFELVVVLDRDGFRAPGLHPKSGADPTTVVWSGYSIESLFLEPAVLATWVRGFLENEPLPQLQAWVEAAIEVADKDAKLNAHAQQTLITHELSAAQRAKGTFLSQTEIGKIQREAAAKVQADPSVYQHGKDRAALVLKKVRTSLSSPRGKQLPATIPGLVKMTDERQIPIGSAFLPMEIEALFAHLNALG